MSQTSIQRSVGTNDVIGDTGVAVNVGGDKTVGVLDHKRDVIQDLGVAANVRGDK
ncbi:hypothetical protein N7527_003566 [Penicillium freii]|nr:hypothetical protein N7527_003566 [Penicillium freii]